MYFLTISYLYLMATFEAVKTLKNHNSRSNFPFEENCKKCKKLMAEKVAINVEKTFLLPLSSHHALHTLTFES